MATGYARCPASMQRKRAHPDAILAFVDLCRSLSVIVGFSPVVKWQDRRGDITAHRVMVAGKVEGNIYAAERVEFHKDSVVQGDISYGSIAVEHGARLLGLVIQNPISSAAANSSADAIKKAQESSS